MENKILGANERAINMEYEEFCKIRESIEKKVIRIQKTAELVSKLDVLCCLAQVAEDMNYSKPEVDSSGIIDIKEGRHPVIEKMLGSGEFVPNDTLLNEEEARLEIITGPKHGR